MVVGCLEAVEVEHQQRALGPVTAAALDLAAQPGLEIAAIEQPRERVGHGVALERDERRRLDQRRLRQPRIDVEEVVEGGDLLARITTQPLAEDLAIPRDRFPVSLRLRLR